MKNQQIEQDSVRCHSGYTYAQRPVSFTYHGQEFQVEQIIAEWREPSERKFLVLTKDGQRFELNFELNEQLWRIRPVTGETPTTQGDQTNHYVE